MAISTDTRIAALKGVNMEKKIRNRVEAVGQPMLIKLMEPYEYDLETVDRTEYEYAVMVLSAVPIVQIANDFGF